MLEKNVKTYVVRHVSYTDWEIKTIILEVSNSKEHFEIWVQGTIC